jgi:oxygen-dependent protoporphyrinogen oxidase
VEKITRAEKGYLLHLSNGVVDRADSVIIATDHFHAQNMLRDYSFMDGYKQMPANSVANVALVFPESVIKRDFDGSGFIVSRNSDHRITACTWVHKKWPGSTPEGKILLRCFLGKPNDQEIVDLSDEEIVKLALNDLNKTMNITVKPDDYVISRFKKTMPQYSVGHLERLARVNAELEKELPGVFLAGGSYEGVGIPDCIDQGKKTVEKVLRYI